MLHFHVLGLDEVFSFARPNAIIDQREELALELVKVAREIHFDFLLCLLRHPFFIFRCELIQCFIVLQNALYFHFEWEAVDLSLLVVHLLLVRDFLCDLPPDKVIKGMHSYCQGPPVPRRPLGTQPLKLEQPENVVLVEGLPLRPRAGRSFALDRCVVLEAPWAHQAYHLVHELELHAWLH